MSLERETIPFGTPNAIGVPPHDRLDLTGTALASIPTNTIVLSNFRALFFGSPLDQFSIAEITVDGTAPPTPAPVWIGLENSDDVGLRVDLRAEVFVKTGTTETKVGQGELNNMPTGSSGFNNAILNGLQITPTGGPAPPPAGSQLLFKLSVRRTCLGGGHASGTVRLWYNGQAIDSGKKRDAGSRFKATIGPTTREYFLRNEFVLSTTAGSPRLFIDKLVDSKSTCPGRPFTSFGTWSVTLP